MATNPMMSILVCKGALDNAMANLNTGGAGSLKVYSGSIPATTLTGASGTLGATLALSATAFASSTNLTSNGLATATANTITNATAAASITAGYFRLLNGSATVNFQGTCGTSSADLIWNTTTFTSGDIIAVTSLTSTLPCGDGVS